MGLREPAVGYSRQALKAIFLSGDTGRNHLHIEELAKVLPANAKAGRRLVFVRGVPAKAHQRYGGISAQDHILSICHCSDCDELALNPRHLRHWAIVAGIGSANLAFFGC